MPNQSEVLKRGGIYPLGSPFSAWKAKSDVRAVWTGEIRAPKKGEWYLSGSIIEAWKAPNDLTMKFHIAKLVRVEETVTTRIIAIDQE